MCANKSSSNLYASPLHLICNSSTHMRDHEFFRVVPPYVSFLSKGQNWKMFWQLQWIFLRRNKSKMTVVRFEPAISCYISSFHHHYTKNSSCSWISIVGPVYMLSLCDLYSSLLYQLFSLIWKKIYFWGCLVKCFTFNYCRIEDAQCGYLPAKPQATGLKYPYIFQKIKMLQIREPKVVF